MRTLRLFAIVAMFVGIGGGLTSASTQDVKSDVKKVADKVAKKSQKETPEETISRLQVVPSDETQIERRKRELALARLIMKQEGEANKARLKALTPEERKADHDVEKAYRDQAKNDNERFKARIATGISCPNPDDKDRVWISDEVSRRWQATTHTSMSVFNQTDSWITIRRCAGTGGSVVVDNLCPGGAINLQERLSTLDMYSTVAYSAVDKEGVLLSQSPQIQMFKCQNIGCQWEFYGSWEIRKRR